MLEGIKSSVTEQLAGQIGGEKLEEMAFMYAALEHEQLSAAQNLLDAADCDGFDDIPDVEDRQVIVQDITRAILTGSFPEWWRENVAAPRFDREPPAELVGCGSDAEAWTDQLDTWAEQVAGEGYEGETRELANEAVLTLYGVGVDEFEAFVVDMNPQIEAKRVLAGNFRATRDAMNRAAESIREENDDGGADE
jgi:hypothetical protein